MEDSKYNKYKNNVRRHEHNGTIMHSNMDNDNNNMKNHCNSKSNNNCTCINAHNIHDIDNIILGVMIKDLIWASPVAADPAEQDICITQCSVPVGRSVGRSVACPNDIVASVGR